MIAAFIAACGVACGIGYNLLTIAAIARFRRRDKVAAKFKPPVSILKPVRGRDVRFYEAIRSHATLDYPDFEILFGIALANDAARDDIDRLEREFPNVTIRVIDGRNDAANGKAGALEILAREARCDFFVVNDSDILVEPDYLTRVVSLLENEAVGLVTCLYRARASSFAANAEALGIATDFAPSVLVARLLSKPRFALGSTMALRRASLDAAGGFAALRDYLADDYQLGARIAALGKEIALADSMVETNLGAGSWREVWRHQIRWARTIRVSNPSGYFGLLITQVTFWSVVAWLTGYRKTAAAGIIVRLAASAVALCRIDRPRTAWLIAVPLRDLFGLAVWCGGLVGSEVEWRGLRFRVQRDGRIARVD